jgi:uncharacterized MAPEG superfamily protein
MLALSIVYAGALVWISAIAQHVNNLTVHGAKWVASDRTQPIVDDGFTGRSTRALRNNLESAAMYVPVALVAFFLHPASAIVTWVPPIYMVVRTTFTLGYWLKINPLRSLSWLIGMICILVLSGSLASGLLSAA